MCGQSSDDVPSVFAACSCIADQRRRPLRTARDRHRRATASAPSKRLAGRYVPKCRLRRAGNPDPDSRRTLPDTAALIRACFARIAVADLEKPCPQAGPPAEPSRGSLHDILLGRVRLLPGQRSACWFPEGHRTAVLSSFEVVCTVIRESTGVVQTALNTWLFEPVCTTWRFASKLSAPNGCGYCVDAVNRSDKWRCYRSANVTISDLHC